ncbi:Inactive pancreatic lipase-related protein 1 [Orchesella cincta]|uniref:Inactive pancreatic lipase-related protein 1 n=1 Tax=Orchesella cincta TaxID=48709 RepID=A0A1D2NH46_ORCCI|nr:Inactive pancreatic lipase-related protein 1 [Orchesella cincta]
MNTHKLLACIFLVSISISGSSSQFTFGDRVTFQGATGPSNPGYRLISRDPRDIKYFLFHRRLDPDAFIELHLGDTSFFNSSTFRRDRPVKFLIHGFNNNGTGTRFPIDTKNAYLENSEHNVIVVDWGKLSTPAVPRRSQADVFYPVVVDNVPMVGENIAKFILFLLDNGMISSLSQVHIIGFSLGAHVSGYAGAYIRQKRQATVSRITGLDPAGPMFSRVPDDGRLDRTDAEFVGRQSGLSLTILDPLECPFSMRRVMNVIHSSRLGLYDDIGHVDFYPNGGRYQFNCIKLSDYDNPFQTFRSFARSLSNAVGSCGHARAPEYFTYSIRQGPEKVLACKCLSWRDYLTACKSTCSDKTTFGEYCPPTARGKYFLEINIRDGDR